jgi:hypothetical protein
MWFMYDKIALPKNCDRLPGVFITRESIMNTNNSMIIWKKIQNPFWMSLGQAKLFEEKKTRDEQFCDTIPLK